MLAVVVPFGVSAAAGWLWLAPDGGTQMSARPVAPSTGDPTPTEPADEPAAEPTSQPTAEPTTPAAPVFTELPPPCGSVSADTVRRLIPQAGRRQSTNSTFTSCTYAPASMNGFRWLRVEARLYSPANTDQPVQDAGRFFAAQWTAAGSAELVRTVTLRRAAGLGDEAYEWFKIDKGQPTAVGEVTVRTRNTLLTVSYSEDVGSAGEAESLRERCLAEAAGVAREVLRDFR